MPDHFYTTDSTGELALKGGWNYEGIQCYVQTEQDPNSTIPVFRYFNNSLIDHFYTTNQTEGTKAVSGGYSADFVGFYMFPPPSPNPTVIDEAPPGPNGTLPLYRLLLGGKNHFYTTNKIEAEAAGGVYEGVAGYVYPTARAGWTPLYRWYKP